MVIIGHTQGRSRDDDDADNDNDEAVLFELDQIRILTAVEGLDIPYILKRLQSSRLSIYLSFYQSDRPRLLSIPSPYRLWVTELLLNSHPS